MRIATAILASLVVTSTSAISEPRRPASDDEVVAVLPARPLRGGEAKFRDLARDPKDPALAARTARALIARSRSEGDPRFLGQAQAALAPWWKDRKPPIDVQLLRAVILQSNHAFRESMEDFRQVLQRDPDHAQALLSLATLHAVTGDPQAGRPLCERLAKPAPMLAPICLASIDAVTGNARSAHEQLSLLSRQRLPAHLLAWVWTLRAETAGRLGLGQESEAAFRVALAADPADAYARAALADQLLDDGREREVLALIPESTPSDPLLLRRAIAARRMRTPDAEDIANRLAARLAAASARGDRLHLREEARFALEVRGARDEALAMATQNWSLQREPADARLLLEAARAARRPAAADDAVRWIRSTGIESRTFDALLREVAL